MASPLDNYVIQPRRPLRVVFGLLTVIALTSLIQWYWVNRDGSEKALLTLENQQLIEKVALLEQQLMQQTETLQNLQQVQTMHQTTVQQLQNQLLQLQNKAIELDKELLFYQNITQGNSSSELQIRDFQLRADPENAAQFRYRLVITQGKNITEPITGEVVIQLQKTQSENGEAKTIELTKLEHPLNLRHVQIVEGTLNLSELATPEQVHISLVQKNKTLAAQTFDWQPIQPDTP